MNCSGVLCSTVANVYQNVAVQESILCLLLITCVLSELLFLLLKCSPLTLCFVLCFISMVLVGSRKVSSNGTCHGEFERGQQC